ncbi:glycosyltransferase [Amycolatopsis suaedae]|uniref:Glycosyltransferase n=1 Tax=Amycolatopsis suaedae TaxID=2510978 RepID=A0A4Q7J075_9PSEU|nr:glycosyltransferase [Amycolatopsis suaedae]RZQ60177.1 glycosyltransferase [Amycolatopsis suaedae]
MNSVRRPILFVSMPESGLLNPLLVLAGEFARRGVPDLAFATDETRRADVERLGGVEFVSMGRAPAGLTPSTMDAETFRAAAQPDRFRSLRAGVELMYQPGRQAEGMRALRAAVDELRPALMVIDTMSMVPIALAVSRGIPFVVSNPFLPSHAMSWHLPLPFGSRLPKGFPAPNTGLPYPMTARQRLANRLFQLRCLTMLFGSTMRDRFGAYTRLCRELDISPEAQRPRVSADVAELVLTYSVAELEYPLDLPPTMRLVGAMLPPLPESAGDDDVTAWLDAHPSVVYVGLGTITQLTRDDVHALVEVARRLDGRHHVLWRLSERQQELLPPAGDLPANLRIESWLPSQLDVLAHPSIKVFLTHGGSNGFHEALYFGKPMVIRPLWTDCHDVAARGRSAGVSLTLDRPHRTEPDDITGKLETVLGDDSYRRRASRLATLLREAGGRVAAADAVLALPALAGIAPVTGAAGVE